MRGYPTPVGTEAGQSPKGLWPRMASRRLWRAGPRGPQSTLGISVRPGFTGALLAVGPRAKPARAIGKLILPAGFGLDEYEDRLTGTATLPRPATRGEYGIEPVTLELQLPINVATPTDGAAEMRRSQVHVNIAGMAAVFSSLSPG